MRCCCSELFNLNIYIYLPIKLTLSLNSPFSHTPKNTLFQFVFYSLNICVICQLIRECKIAREKTKTATYIRSLQCTQSKSIAPLSIDIQNANYFAIDRKMPSEIKVKKKIVFLHVFCHWIHINLVVTVEWWEKAGSGWGETSTIYATNWSRDYVVSRYPIVSNLINSDLRFNCLLFTYASCVGHEFCSRISLPHIFFSFFSVGFILTALQRVRNVHFTRFVNFFSPFARVCVCCHFP